MDDRIERLGGIQRFADSYRIYNPWRDKVRRGTLDISARSNDSKFPFHRPWNNRNAVRSNEKGLIFYDPIFFWYLERKSKPLLHSRTRGESMKKRLFIHPHDSPRRRRLKKRKTAPFSRADELFRGRPRLEIHESPFHDRSPLLSPLRRELVRLGIVGYCRHRLHRKSNNFLGEIAATVYQHVGHLSNGPCGNGVLHLWYSSNDKTRRCCVNQPPPPSPPRMVYALSMTMRHVLTTRPSLAGIRTSGIRQRDEGDGTSGKNIAHVFTLLRGREEGKKVSRTTDREREREVGKRQTKIKLEIFLFSSTISLLSFLQNILDTENTLATSMLMSEERV